MNFINFISVLNSLHDILREKHFSIGMCRISSHFLISGIRPDTGYALPDIRPDIRYPAKPDIRPEISLSWLQACAVGAGNSSRMRNESLSYEVANMNNI